MKISLIALIFFVSGHLFANDHEAPAAAEEAPAEGHGSGTAVKSTLPAWVEVESKLSALEARVKAKELTIEKLLGEKNHIDSKDPKMKDLITEIAKEHKEMRAAAEDLEKQKTILRYRFPERGADPKRKYEKVEIRSLKEMEANLGIEGRLQRTFKRAQQQYGETENKSPTSKHSNPIDNPPESEKPHDGGAIILQK